MDDKEYWKLWATGQPPVQSFKPTPPDGFIQPGESNAHSQVIDELDLRLDEQNPDSAAQAKAAKARAAAQSGPSAAQSFAKQSTSQPFPRPSQSQPIAAPAAPKQEPKAAGPLAKPQGPQPQAKPATAQPFGRQMPQDLPTAPKPPVQKAAEPALLPPEAEQRAAGKGFASTTASGKPLAKPSSPYDIIKPRPSQESERKPGSQAAGKSEGFKSQGYDMSSIATPPKTK